LVHEQKGQVVAAKIKRSKGNNLVVDAKFNEILIKAVVETAAMLTLVNRKYVDNESANYEAAMLKGIVGQ
jgi:ribosomal protein L35AE/L33A